MNGQTKKAILRRWKAGMKLWAIAEDLRQSEHNVAKVLHGNGATWFNLESRHQQKPCKSD